MSTLFYSQNSTSLFRYQDTTDGFILSYPASADYTDIEDIVFDCPQTRIDTQDPGYLLLPRAVGCEDYCLFYFQRHTEDFETELSDCNMPLFGFKTKDSCYLVVISGMSYEYSLKILRQNGYYHIYPIFHLHKDRPEEDLKIEFFRLTGTDADYSGMARCYRRLTVQRRHMKPISERMKEYPALSYAKDSVYIRIRQAWKPAPAEILHQTPENEPPMHIACDFDRVGDILDELKRQGIEKAELCLVGWNIKGHDGRWPQYFPVDPELGGEEKLRKIIAKAKAMGYAITCHTNSSDQYEIGNNFSYENTRLDHNGEMVINSEIWSGGQMYQLCPQKGWEITQEMLPKVAELGFSGLHYIDVLGTVFPRRCYHPDHPVTMRQCTEYARRCAVLSRELFGGFATEGCYDYMAPYIDYGLYASFNHDAGDLCDRSVPFLELVYHGFILYNAFTETVNAPFKSRRTVLKAIEYGSRPSFYFHAVFMNNGFNWMGTSEPRCDNDEILRDSVFKIKTAYNEYQSLLRLQTLTMDKHEMLSDGVFAITYSDGTVMTVDYNQESYTVTKA